MRLDFMQAAGTVEMDEIKVMRDGETVWEQGF